MPRAPRKQTPAEDTPAATPEDPQDATGEDTPTPDAPTDARPPDAPEYRRTGPGEFNPAVQDLLLLAQDLEEDRASVLARIAANRDMLRSYAVAGVLNADQESAIHAFYPKRTRVRKDENGDAAQDTAAADTPADDTEPAATAA